MATRGFTGRGRSGRDRAWQLPPGQTLTDDFPRASAGPTPRVDTATWTFTLKIGPKPVKTWTWDAFSARCRRRSSPAVVRQASAASGGAVRAAGGAAQHPAAVAVARDEIRRVAMRRLRIAGCACRWSLGKGSWLQLVKAAQTPRGWHCKPSVGTAQSTSWCITVVKARIDQWLGLVRRG